MHTCDFDLRNTSAFVMKRWFTPPTPPKFARKPTHNLCVKFGVCEAVLLQGCKVCNASYAMSQPAVCCWHPKLLLHPDGINDRLCVRPMLRDHFFFVAGENTAVSRVWRGACTQQVCQRTQWCVKIRVCATVPFHGCQNNQYQLQLTIRINYN